MKAGSLLIVLIALCGCPRVSPPRSSVTSQYERYVALRKLKERIKVSVCEDLPALEIAAQLNPDDAEVILLWARHFAQRGQNGVAEQLASRAVEVEPGFAEGWYVLGELLDGRGETRGARESFVRATTLDPLSSHYLARLGEMERGDPGDFTTTSQKVRILVELSRGKLFP